MAIYIVMTIGTFACILLMRRRGGLTETIDDLSGLSQTNTGLALILTILFLSLAGVPPTAGFLGKLYVFQAAVSADMVWLAIVGAVMSVISAYYYLRVVWIIWFNEPAPAFEREVGSTLGMTAFISAVLVFPLLLVFFSPVATAAKAAAASLF